MPNAVRLEITRREPFAGGRRFGDVGAYELIGGRFTLAVDPKDAGNPRIVDLELAPRDGDGRVGCGGDFTILRPADLARGNRTIFYDVVNRGNKYCLGYFNDAPQRNRLGTQDDRGSDDDGGNGYLMRRGYTVVWSAWQGDILPVDDRVTFEAPVAREGDGPITGPVRSELLVADDGIDTLPLSGNLYTASYPTTSLDTRTATLTRRHREEDLREPLAADAWQFARRDESGALVPSREHIHLPGGFAPSLLYELIYQGRDPKVMGLGLLAVRDLVNVLRSRPQDDAGAPNPVWPASTEGAATPQRAYAWGVSQCGRFLREFVYRGYNVAGFRDDSAAPRVFDGVISHVAGAGRVATNYRFAQPGRYPRRHEDHLYPADSFPFAYAETTDPASGRRDAILKRPTTDPLIFHTQSASEYWNRGGSLAHSDPASGDDLAEPDNLRLYLFSGLEHGAGRTSPRLPGRVAYPPNDVRAAPIGRALLDALDGWVREGEEPPASRIPRRGDGSAIAVEEGPGAFPTIPGVVPPDRAYGVSPIDRGPRFESAGLIEIEPPHEDSGRAYPLLLPAVDADGNDIPGIRLPEIAAPLATFTGWNVWRDREDAPPLHVVDGSSFAFPLTPAAHERTGDPRLSVAERYRTQEDYAAAVAAACRELVEARLMLEEDAECYLARARETVLPIWEGAAAPAGDSLRVSREREPA